MMFPPKFMKHDNRGKHEMSSDELCTDGLVLEEADLVGLVSRLPGFFRGCKGEEE